MPKKTTEETYKISSYVFLKFLSIIYFIAFISAVSQIVGLVGENGILPANDFLNAAKLHLESSAYYRLPTLGWISSSDLFLKLLCYLGALFAVLLFLENSPVPLLLGMWTAYLSITIVGQVFFSFQWDNLLLEVGLLAIFLAPFSKYIKTPFDTSKIVVFLFQLLLFKLMFMSGLVKLLSGDESWRNLTALTYHYETQPLPNPIAFTFNALPKVFHIFSAFLMFIIELIVPIFIFMKKKYRLIAFVSFFLLQFLILITGNYCFFNLLTILVSVFLIDDATWEKFIPKYKPGRGKNKPKYIIWHRYAMAPIAALIVFMSFIQLVNYAPKYMPGVIHKIYSYVTPFRSINSYGLFAVMTKKRMEIILEGSDDGETWKAYEFKHKPGEVNKRLPIVAPHQPRLDWQMWFAALGSYKNNRWFVSLCQKMLQGNKYVLSLFKENPFPNKPPRYIRALSYEYKFTSLGELRSTGNRWERKYIGLYAPMFTISN